ncbi:hypothetical protein NL364_31185, partial [Klebsiella pneumoniae]|nr:hypothetical protein [Klebsiella pneumoniae]
WRVTFVGISSSLLSRCSRMCHADDRPDLLLLFLGDRSASELDGAPAMSVRKRFETREKKPPPDEWDRRCPSSEATRRCR